MSAATMNHSTTILRVLSVVDTREYLEERDGRFVAVAGSGVEHSCQRCSRMHEVHATVLLSDGTEAIVGTSCARGESIAVQGDLKRGAARAKRIAAITAEIRDLKRQQVVYARFAKGVAKLYCHISFRPAAAFERKLLLADVGVGRRKREITVAYDRTGIYGGDREYAARRWQETLEAEFGDRHGLKRPTVIHYALMTLEGRLARALKGETKK